MFVQIHWKGLYLRLLSVVVIILKCHSVNHSFCNDFNQITNTYSFGRFVFIIQGMKTLWKFDTNNLQFSKDEQTIGSIFGPDQFETVDTTFGFQFGPCLNKASKYCANIEKARNIVMVIGEKTKAMDSSKTYGYIAYRLNDDNTIDQLPKDFAHQWGITARDTFRGNFWPPFKRNGSLIVGSAYSRLHKTLYLLVNEIDDHKNPVHRIYTRDLEEGKGWGEWTAFTAEKLNGMFTIGGKVFVVDTDSNIKSYRMEKSGLIDKKTISSAKEFFNCMSNSSLRDMKTSAESRVNDPNGYNAPDYNDGPTDNQTGLANSTEQLTNFTIATGATVIKAESSNGMDSTMAPIATIQETTTLPSEQSSSKGGSGWPIILVVVLVLALIIFIVLIAIFFHFKNKTKEEKQAKPSATGPPTLPKGEKPSPATSTTGTDPDMKKSSASVESVRSEI